MGIMSRISGLADAAGFGNLSKAFAETAMDSAALSRSVCNNIMANDGKRVINQALNHVDDLSDDVAKAFKDAVNSGKTEDIMDIIRKNEQTLDSLSGKSEAFQTAMKTYKEHAGIYAQGTGMDTARQLLGRADDKAGLGIKGTLQGFYGDADYGNTRLKATIAGAAGVAVGGRLLSGGSLTTNARGEHDIAGIPFI